MRTKLYLVLIMFCATAALAQQNDWLIVPGKRLGPITSNTTRAGLVRLFGEANIHDQPVDSGEGPETATVVFPKTPFTALAVFWQNNRMDRVMVCYQHEAGPCKWHTADKVSLGTSLRQLEILNSRPFQIEGWGSDVGGNVSSWQGGKLAGSFGEGENCQVVLTLGWQEPPDGATPQQRGLEKQLDQQRRNPLSSDLAVRRIHPRVTRMMVIFRSQQQARNREVPPIVKYRLAVQHPSRLRFSGAAATVGTHLC